MDANSAALADRVDAMAQTTMQRLESLADILLELTSRAPLKHKHVTNADAHDVRAPGTGGGAPPRSPGRAAAGDGQQHGEDGGTGRVVQRRALDVDGTMSSISSAMVCVCVCVCLSVFVCVRVRV